MSRRRTDDATGRLWIEEGESREGLVASVAPILPVHRSYTFSVPDELAATVGVGQRVIVPIGRTGRETPAFVLSLEHTTWHSTLRPILRLVDTVSFLTPPLIELGRRIAAHYACPLGITLKAMTPEAARRERGLRKVRYAELADPPPDPAPGGARRSAARSVVLAALQAAGGPMAVAALLEQTGASTAVLRGLVQSGLVRLIVRKEQGAGLTDEPAWEAHEPDFEPTADQQLALASILGDLSADRFAATLLFGVSGSGKTEVYVRAMRAAVAQGRQAILLVPEIMLTTQLVARLASRFADVAVVHSAMTETQRSLIWRQVAAGEKTVVIGTRSAVFAPCPRLGLICVDEEQETSYKNMQAPRFHVRDVAVLRAHQLGIPVVLGSATPSMESWYSSSGREGWKRVGLPQRVKELPLPTVYVVDLREEIRDVKAAPLVSRTMLRMLQETLAAGGQAVILLNRRGYASRIRCERCLESVRCPRCTVGMVLHTSTGESRCHYCHTRMAAPQICSVMGCGGRLVAHGAGTQRAEDVLSKLLPGAKLRRADSDTMTHRDHYRSLVEDFAARRIDVLIGTQMIAKGLDFPAVSFVGVLDADTAPLESDFRAQEHLFQLMTQVAGRAGRAEQGGRVVIQTTMPQAPALRHAAHHDYEAFARDELGSRSRTNLPPFVRLTRVLLSHERDELTRHEAEAMTLRILATIKEMKIEHADVLGPQACLRRRLRGRYRYDLLIRTKTAADMHALLQRLREAEALRSKASAQVDVDPVDLS
jgi:primosomal protein N' (replication factor Y)